MKVDRERRIEAKKRALITTNSSLTYYIREMGASLITTNSSLTNTSYFILFTHIHAKYIDLFIKNIS